DVLVKQFLRNPVLHSVDEANTPVAEMTHHVFDVAGAEEKKRLVEALAGGTGRRILFMRTKHQAKKLAKHLTAIGIPAVELQGNLSQPRREANLAAFSDGTVRVLVATDVAARGVHVDEVELVVHVDPPTEHKAYLHRSGRTARAGSRGDVVTLVLPEQRKDTADVLRKAAIRVRSTLVTAESPQVAALIGEVADRVHLPVVAQPTVTAPARAAAPPPRVPRPPRAPGAPRREAVHDAATETVELPNRKRRRRRRGGRGERMAMASTTSGTTPAEGSARGEHPGRRARAAHGERSTHDAAAGVRHARPERPARGSAPGARPVRTPDAPDSPYAAESVTASSERQHSARRRPRRRRGGGRGNGPPASGA
ncbi:MAG: hypothetical protein MUE41_10690, partial [Gemmatimonadaceae bacterium]|nr:hypothetical protein [Gemmatimonadaceae bacterium]